jgi:peptide/nickel transport system substrate-binding protein
MTTHEPCFWPAAMALALTGAAQAQDVPREDTVIFDLDRTIRDPENFNWMTDGTGIRRMQGAHQVMWEPLFILNYNTASSIRGWPPARGERGL